MKIGFEAKRAFYNNRGLGNYSRTLLSNLFRFYPENTYYLFSPGKGPELFKIPTQGVKLLTPTGFNSICPSLWRSFFSSGEIKKNNIEIFHGLSHEIPYKLKDKNPKTKVIVTIHDLLYLRLPEFFPWIDRRVYDLKFKHACKQADHIISCSDQTKNDLINYLKIKEDKIQTIYQSASDDFYQDLNPKDIEDRIKNYNLSDKYFLSVGALVKNKNFSLLLYTLEILKKEITHKLVIVGSGEKHKQELIQLASNLELKDRLLILENVNKSDLPYLYAGAAAFLYPSLFEGFGIPLLEAGLTGTPILTSRNSCFPEVAGSLAQYTNSFEPQEWALSVKEILKNDAKYIRKNIKEDFYQRFSPQKLSAQLRDLYLK